MLAEAEEEDAEEDPVVATGEADDNIIGQRKTHSGRTPTFLLVVSRFQLNSSTVKLSTVTDGHRCFRLPPASTSASPNALKSIQSTTTSPVIRSTGRKVVTVNTIT